MEVKNCRGCGRLFNYIGGSYILCPGCLEKLDEKFQQVKKYITENPSASIPEISRENEVSVMQIERWVREERLTFTEDSPIGIECESCGTMIKSGRYCANCKDTMQRNFGNLYKNDTKVPDRNKDARERARMRFLDN